MLETTTSPAPFDLAADNYDELFERNHITQHIRPIVWESLFKYFKPGNHILELHCGTGTDAVVLAQRGIQMTAIDQSQKMLQIAQTKIDSNNLTNSITLRQMNLDSIDIHFSTMYDGMFSNFGGMNCVENLPRLLTQLTKHLKPGGNFVLCMINKICLWEITTFLMKFQGAKAFRRMTQSGTEVSLNRGIVKTWYYTPRQIVQMLSPQFKVHNIYGLSIVSPPPNSRRFVFHNVKLTYQLLSIDRFIRGSFPFYALGDHFVIEAQRTSDH